jgi:hypothetical protein
VADQPGPESQALAWLRDALIDLYIQDRELLELKAGETALAFRLGLHLSRKVTAGWDVDAEYDRQGRHGELKEKTDGKHMRPDLVVHRRGSGGPENNLLFLEMKRHWRSTSGDGRDRRKVLQAVTRHNYQIGVALGLTHRAAYSPFAPLRRPVSSADALMDPEAAKLPGVPVFTPEELDQLAEAADEAESLRWSRS